MEKIITYLCDKFSGMAEYEKPDEDVSAVEAVDGIVKAGLWPKAPVPGCQIGVGKVIARLLNKVHSRYVCPNGKFLSWKRKEIAYEHEPVGLEDYITIEIENPNHCQWIMSSVLIYGADLSPFGRLFGHVSVGSGGQSCPDDKKDVFSGGSKSEFELFQNAIVPGERIELRWAFWDLQHTEEISVDAEWFCTCCFTGGKVKSVNGDYGQVGITYTVEINGVEQTCVSSDFVEYEVGDWVFVLASNSNCEECGRVFSCRQPCEIKSVLPGNGKILLDLTNNTREGMEVEKLIKNSKLNKAAERHAKDMAANHFQGHTGSDGSTPESRISDTGYLKGGSTTAGGENVGSGQETIHEMFDGWMGSAEHYANIVHPIFREMGFAVKSDEDGKKYWCQVFGFNDSHSLAEEGVISDFIILPLRIGNYGP